MTNMNIVAKTVTIDELQQQLRQLVEEVAAGKTRLTIERDGEALVRMERATSTEQTEINALLQDPEFQDLAAISETLQGYSLEELEEQIAEGLRAGRE